MRTVVDNVTNHGRANAEEGEDGGTLCGWVDEGTFHRCGFALLLCCPHRLCAPSCASPTGMGKCVEGYLFRSGLERRTT